MLDAAQLSLIGAGLLLGDAGAIIGTLVTILLLLGVCAILVVKTLLYVCLPSEVLIFSGRSRKTADGKTAGYRIIRGGRALRVPLLETVDRMDLTNMIIEVQVRNAYSKGGIPLAIQGVANITLSGGDQRLGASFFNDPHRAQEIRQSDNGTHEAFWERWKAFGDQAARQCK